MDQKCISDHMINIWVTCPHSRNKPVVCVHDMIKIHNRFYVCMIWLQIKLQQMKTKTNLILFCSQWKCKYNSDWYSINYVLVRRKGLVGRKLTLYQSPHIKTCMLCYRCVYACMCVCMCVYIFICAYIYIYVLVYIYIYNHDIFL